MRCLLEIETSNGIVYLNPLTVSKIDAIPGLRRFKNDRKRNFKRKLLYKKIEGSNIFKIWFYELFIIPSAEFLWLDLWEPAHILFLGSNGQTMMSLTVKSNAAAEKLKNKYVQMLDNCLEKFSTDYK